jgi:hypothetical protein
VQRRNWEVIHFGHARSWGYVIELLALDLIGSFALLHLLQVTPEIINHH